jgi:hypothetical protein
MDNPYYIIYPVLINRSGRSYSFCIPNMQSPTKLILIVCSTSGFSVGSRVGDGEGVNVCVGSKASVGTGVKFTPPCPQEDSTNIKTIIMKINDFLFIIKTQTLFL